MSTTTPKPSDPKNTKPTDPNTDKDNDNVTPIGTQIGEAGSTAFKNDPAKDSGPEDEPMIVHKKPDGTLSDPIPVKDWAAYEKKHADDIR